MNVALPTLVVFLLLLPGFIFRSGLKRIERTSIDFSPFGSVAAEAVVWSALLHSIWLGFSYFVFKKFLEPVIFMNLLSSLPSSQAVAMQRVGADSVRVGEYFLSLILASYIFPRLIRNLITHLRLDRDGSVFSPYFRFHDAPWYYLLTGADFEKDEQPDFIIISAVVELAKEAVLFVGILDDFYFDSDGQLDRLILQKVSRRPISSDKPSTDVLVEQLDDKRFYPIDGDNFVLRYSEAITLNVQYGKLTSAE